MNSKTFEAQFRDKLDEIETRAKEAGLNMTIICRETGISRATPDRWKRSLPKTVELVTAMEAVVEKRENEIATSIPGELR